MKKLILSEFNVINILAVSIIGLFVVMNITAAQGQSPVIRDDSGNAFHGAGNNVFFASGKRNESLSFNGTKSLVKVNDKGQINSSGSLSLEAWVYSERPSGDTEKRRIISKDKTSTLGKFVLWEEVTSAGKTQTSFMVNQSEQWYKVVYSGALPTKTWVHLTAVYDQTTKKIKIYMNGSKVAESSGPQSLKVNTEAITIGGSEDNKQNWIGRIDEVRIYQKTLSDSEILESYNNGTVFKDQYLKLVYSFDKPATLTSDLTIWALADPHIHTDAEQTPPYYSMTEALNDAKSSNGFHYDFGIIGGDIAGGQGCPSEPTDSSYELLNQFQKAGVNPNLFYSVIGNHDVGQNAETWFRKWVDPLGGNTSFSGINNNDSTRKKLSGYWDHYSFQEGNILFLMLGDDNAYEAPFGRDCSVGGGYPAGNYTKETFDWWKNMVEENQDKIIITVAHHGLMGTTVNTGVCDGWANSSHGGKNWFDRRGSSMIYAIDGVTIDGLTSSYIETHPIDTTTQCYSQGAVEWRDYGFKNYLDNHPGAIDMWLHGHTHYKTNPDSIDTKGRGTVAYLDNVTFVNLGAVTTKHGPADVPYSRVLEFAEGSDQVTIKTFLHKDWNTASGTHPKGFYSGAEVTVPLKKAFQK